jgi:serine protease AprX
MKYGKVIVVWLFIACLLSDKATASQFVFQITFTDKNNTPYSLSSPLAYLSARSVARRAAQGIAIDSTDLPVNASYIDTVLTLAAGSVFHGSSKWLNMCIILVSDSAQIINLSGKPYISEIKLVGYYGTDLHPKSSIMQGAAAASAPARKTTSFDASYYGATWDQTSIVAGQSLHNKGFQGQGMLIAVMDAGFLNSNSNPGFDSLRSSGRLVDSFDFVWRDNNILRQDDHGSQALSVMAGYWPGTFVGSAPLAMYALYLTEYNPDDQPAELDNLLFATERADSIGADVISESVGYDVFSFPAGAGQVFADLDGKTTVGAKAANMATQKGMLFVATAGNDGTPSIPGWGTHILTPGDADSALTIGSTDVSGNPAPSSGFGPNAAGVVKPDVSTLGHLASVLVGATVSTNDGTSFSTPEIAGWAACLWQANPGSTPYQLRQSIIKCASHYTSPGPQLGYGVPNFQCTGQLLKLEDTPAPFSASHWVIVTPNPFTSTLKVTVQPETDGNVDFIFMDMTGRKIAAWQQFLHKDFSTSLDFSTPALAPGIYILKATSSGHQQVLKLVKQ